MSVPDADDIIVFALACVGAYTVGRYLGEAVQAHRMLFNIPDDARRLS